MSPLPLEPLGAPVGAGVPVEPAGGVDDWLAGRRAQLAAGQQQDFAIPGYGGRLVARYCKPSLEQSDAMELQLQQGEDRLSVAVQALIDVTVEIAEINPDTGDRTRVDDGYGPALARRLRVAFICPRDTVLATFAGDEPMFAAHFHEVDQWSVTVVQVAEAQALGESSARAD